MKLLLTLALVSAISTRSFALSSREAEVQYHTFSEELLEGEVSLEMINGLSLSSHHRKILVDSLWDYTVNPENAKKLASSQKVWKGLDFNSMPLPEKVRLYLLGLLLDGSKTRLTTMRADLEKRLTGKLDNRTLIILFNHAETLLNEGLGRNLDEVEVANLKFKYEYDLIVKSGSEKLSDADLRELFALKPEPLKTFIFVACRSNRSHPCMLVVKDRKGWLVRKDDEDLWGLPALTKSKYGFPFNLENGNTPSGLYHVESVMPSADKQTEYGKNRRLIVRFASMAQAQKFLPKSQQNRAWWRQMFLAAELGRENLRIHGTGKMNSDADSLHPTLVPSLGCVKLREGKYDDVTYNDQRVFLDTLMRAQGLKPIRSNETAIRAHLLIFNVPGTGPVTLDDLQDYFE